MPCVCASFPHFSKKSVLNLHRSYILAPTERPAGSGVPKNQQERGGADRRSKPTSTASNGVGVLLRPRRLPPRAPAAPRLLHLLQVSNQSGLLFHYDTLLFQSRQQCSGRSVLTAGCGMVPCVPGRIVGSWRRRGRWAPPGGCSAHPGMVSEQHE